MANKKAPRDREQQIAEQAFVDAAEHAAAEDLKHQKAAGSGQPAANEKAPKEVK